MDVEKIEQLIQVLEGSRTEELLVRKDDCTILIRKGLKRKPVAAKAPAPTLIEDQPAGSPETAVDEHFVLAPMVGIFHASDGVTRVGANVAPGQVMGAIESMKLLNDVVAEVSGRVTEVMVEDGTPVEYGQPLCRVEPA